MNNSRENHVTRTKIKARHLLLRWLIDTINTSIITVMSVMFLLFSPLLLIPIYLVCSSALRSIKKNGFKHALKNLFSLKSLTAKLFGFSLTIAYIEEIIYTLLVIIGLIALFASFFDDESDLLDEFIIGYCFFKIL